jgi:hypothetical protein
MPAIRFSTLTKLSEVSSTPLDTLFPKVSFHLLDFKHDDYLIEMNAQEEEKIDRLFNTLNPPQGNSEYTPLLQKINKSKLSINLLKNAPFRQSRNAYGTAGALAGGLNLIFTNLFALGALSSILILGPAVIAGGWVYWRGKREEHQINMDLDAELYCKQLSILTKYQELLELRKESTPLCEKVEIETKPLKPHLIQNSKPHITYTVMKPYKEKRGLLGNSFAHFWMNVLSACGLSVALIKFGVLGAAIALGGPLSWGIAAGIGLGIGLAFAYKRYQHLAKKIAHEKNMTELTAEENKLQREIVNLRTKQTETYKTKFKKFSSRENHAISQPTPAPTMQPQTTSAPTNLPSHEPPKPVNYYTPVIG